MIYKEEKLLLKTIKEKQKEIPLWFMRQAGRYLPEYQKVRKKFNNFLEMCFNTEIVTELTLQPIKRFDIDAAIIFSDIMVIPDVLGCKVEFIEKIGPKVLHINSYKELNEKADIENMLLPILKAIKHTKQLLPKEKTLIGFAGSPWTLATYMIEKEKNFSTIKKMAYCNTSDLQKIIDIITESVIIFLLKQIKYGVDVIQLFDSNAGILPCEEFKKWVIEPTKKIVHEIRKQYPDFPIIGFPKGAGVMYKNYSEETEVSVISVDYLMELDWIKSNIKIPIQGNLDPFVLAYTEEEFLKQTANILQVLEEKRLIFNLGHGIIPETPIKHVEKLIELVRSHI